jgi:hypothetical protein
VKLWAIILGYVVVVSTSLSAYAQSAPPPQSAPPAQRPVPASPMPDGARPTIGRRAPRVQRPQWRHRANWSRRPSAAPARPLTPAGHRSIRIRNGRARADAPLDRANAAIGHAGKARHLRLPGRQVINAELVEMRVPAGARQDLHQLHRRFEEARQSFC